jgi:hypothetical protein
MAKIAKVSVWVPNLDSLNKVLSTVTAHLECGGPKQDGEHFVVTLYMSPAEAHKLRALGFRYEADEKFGDVLKQRQKEVSKKDRFKGGKVKPEGLGIKR